MRARVRPSRLKSFFDFSFLEESFFYLKFILKKSLVNNRAEDVGGVVGQSHDTIQITSEFTICMSVD